MPNVSEIVKEETVKLADLIPVTGNRVANVMLLLAGAIAVGAIISYGIMLATSQGDEGKMEQAKKGLMYSILGIIVISLSLVIANLITKVVFINVNN